MKTINKILSVAIILVLSYMLGKGLVDSQQSESKSETEPKYNLTLSLEDVISYYPESDSIALEDVNLYGVFKNGNKIGRVVNTSPFSDEIFGYNGRTPLNIFLDSEGRIFEVEICENKESRGYLNKVVNSGYFDLWDGLTAKEAANHNVDAVSGCTYTSVAVAQSLQLRMQDLAKEKGIRSLDWKLLARQLSVLLVTIMSLICFFNPKKTKKLRIATLLLSIAVLGFWTNSLLSLALFYNWITNGISLSLQIPILTIAALAILLPLFTKKSFYCQYLCPFGAAQEFVGMIPIKRQRTTDNRQQTSSRKSNGLDVELVETTGYFDRLSDHITANVFKIFSILRKVILLTLLIIVALGVGLDLSLVEPFPIFNYQSIGFGIAVFAGVIIVASVFIKKPWCNYLCPTGTLLEIFRKRL